MMIQDNFYDIDLLTLIGDILPTDERTIENRWMMYGLFKGIERTHHSFLDFKRGADISSNWVLWFSTTFFYGDRIIYFNSGEVYECVVTSTSSEPTTSTDWVKVSDSFIGNDEIQLYNGSKISLEYALNRRFYTQFYQPPTQSDIYISTINTNPLVFVIGANASNSSIVYSNISSEFVINSNTFTTVNDFTIFIPTSLDAVLGTDAEKIIRDFVDRYITFGLKYLIQTY
jgi:hypothetical protein